VYGQVWFANLSKTQHRIADHVEQALGVFQIVRLMQLGAQYEVQT